MDLGLWVRKNYGLVSIISAVLVQVIYTVLYRDLFLQFNFLFVILVFCTRYLSGLGIFSTFSIITLYLLKYSSPIFRKRKRLSKYLIYFLNVLAVVFFIIIVAQAVLAILHEEHGYILTLVGLWFTVGSFYIVPIWREDKTFKLKRSMLDYLKEILGKAFLNIKEGYYKYLSRDYLRAYSIEYLKFRIRLDALRYRVARWIFPIAALSVMIFPMLFILLIFVLIRLYVLRDPNITTLDKIIVISSLVFTSYYIIVLTYSGFTPFASAVFWNIPYILGAVASFAMYLKSITS